MWAASGLEYSLGDNGEARIYGETEVTPLITALDSEKCAVIRIASKSESLESYFINLVGGESK